MVQEAVRTLGSSTVACHTRFSPSRHKRSVTCMASSKTAKILDLLKRPGGATSKDLMKATGWLPHSVRGFLFGTVRKKLGLTVTSTKGENGERTYSVEA